MASTIIRSMHDLGLASWFGGSLMGAVGLNGAAAQAKDPAERTGISAKGWQRWSPVQAVGIGAHLIGGAALIIDNRNRVRHDDGTQANTLIKAGLTVVTAGVTAWSGALGHKVWKLQDEGAKGATEPGATTSPELASAQKQLKYTQWIIPALTGTLIVLGAQQGEQQRGLKGLLDLG